MDNFNEKIIEVRKEIREANRENKIFGENSESHALQSARYQRLADVLNKKAESFVEKPPEPESQDTF
jgi:hypothetical protein